MPYKDSEKQKASQREIMKRAYLADPNKFRLRDRARYETMKLFIDSHKKECSKCGITDTRVLDFHHKDRNNKVFSLGSTKRSRSKEKILIEIEKCIVLCANCHRIEESANGRPAAFEAAY